MFLPGPLTPQRQSQVDSVVIAVPFLYTSLLSLLTFLITPRWRETLLVQLHQKVVLFVTFMVYFYRDIFSLAIYGGKPQDSGGWFLWFRIAMLGYVSVVFPIVISRGGGYGLVSSDPKGLWTDSQIAPLKRIVNFAHAQGVKIGVQLAHAGRKALTYAPWVQTAAGGMNARKMASKEENSWPDEVVGPTSTPWNEKYPVPKELTKEQLIEIEDAFVSAIERAEQVGYEFGGQPLENRLRFPLSFISQCRSAWSKPLFVRISAADWAEGPEKTADNTWAQWGIQQSTIFAGEMEKIGVDLVDARTKGRGRHGGKAGVVKQTAQKSTRAPAPRVPLGISTVKASPAPKSANKGGKKPIPAKRDIKLKAPQPKIKMHGAAIQHLSGAMGFGVLIMTKMGVELYTEQQFLENNKNPPVRLLDPVVKPGVVLGAIHPLKIWAADDLVYCAVPFDFKDDTSDYLEAMNDVVNQLQDGVLQRVKKIVVVVSTHTDPQRGDFHIIPDCGGSVPFDELANVLFPEDLRVQLRARGFWSQLVLLACGSFWRMREPVTQIFDFVKDIGFDHALGFSAQNLQTALTTAFVQHALENFVIHGDRRTIIPILPEHSRTGSHSGIVSLNPFTKEILEFLWHHPLMSPFGDPSLLHAQCSKCGVLSPWVNVDCRPGRDSIHRLTVQCKRCHETQTIDRPAGLRKVTGGGDNASYLRHSTGDWMVRTIEIETLRSVE
ncbi:hypothetical protein AAF712_009712 [Marasmius tenuissimus]|uniref:NADH:flavin oxidoreductase/NADH oxidase N-terminal domain-containing protein n=1 Tax=Marasmius tenuissimus TaxID=585030 RepID=A0ABR2ZPW4_9AGAR